METLSLASILGVVIINSFQRMVIYFILLAIGARLFIYFTRRKRVVLANLTLILVLLLGAETIFFFLLGRPPMEIKRFQVAWVDENHIEKKVGFMPAADSVYHGVRMDNGNVVFDVHYTIDHNHMRVTPGHDSSRKEFALFFGCSIAFGEGLEDNQTFPYHFQQLSKRYNAYNFATSGQGTNHMLAKLEYYKLPEIVKEKSGVGIYIFFWDHLRRSIGSMKRYTDWLSTAPYYKFEDGQLVRNRTFKDGRYVTSKIYEYIYHSSILKYYQVDFPMRLNNNHYDLVSEMILESRKKFKDQTGSDRFYVLWFPSYIKYTPGEKSEFMTVLDKKGIKVIDFSDIINYSGEYTIGIDPHPNSKTNELLAGELLKRIATTKEVN